MTSIARSRLLRFDPKVIRRESGHSYIYVLPGGCPEGDVPGAETRSQAALFEDGVELGPTHARHDEIRGAGRGRFSHYGKKVYFSSSDNTPPGNNGRVYELLLPGSMFSPAVVEEFEINQPGVPPKAALLWLRPDRMTLDAGHSYIYELPAQVPLGDDTAARFQSQALLFENGRELGPRHARHEDIRAAGQGRFSHFGRQLHFSTSDNSSPAINGRSYQLLVPSVMFAPEDLMQRMGLGGLAVDQMSALDRYDLACQAFRTIWRDVALPDHGRRIESDKEFAREYDRLYQGTKYTYERAYNLNELLRLVVHLPGDFAECGVYKGATAFFLAQCISSHRLKKRLCLFDSFKGLSSPAPVDGSYWSAGNLSSSIEDVKASLAPLGGLDFVEFYQGWIPSRFAEVADRRFCFVHIDVDLHQPTQDAIAFFYPRLEPGGLIVLDDYGFDTCPGATAAVDDFMHGKPEPIVNLASGGAFIMKRS